MVKVYSGRVWIGPGRSYWSTRFIPHSTYTQIHELCREITVPVWFADLVSMISSHKEEIYLVQEARRMGYLD